MTDAGITRSQISEAITQLRQLTQQDIQTGWRFCAADLPLAEATDSQRWHDWQTVSLNDRAHVAWPAGRNVLWLGQQIVIPADLHGYPLTGLTLRLGLTWWAELAQIFVNGQLVQEGDLFDCSTRILLSESAQPGEAIAVALRLISPGHDNGALVRSACIYEVGAPTESSDPAIEPGFVADELAVLQQYLSALALDKLEIVQAAIAQIDWSALPGGENSNSHSSHLFDQSLSHLRQQLKPLGDWLKQRQIQLIGHAHLDLAWLWPVSETWEAAERTFKSVLQLQQDFAELIFCHSTPALYAWLEAHRPELFTAIQAQVKANRWEVVGGLWVEPELNTVSGESIVRQVLYGQRYTQEKFGQLAEIAWLPDSFGFSWQLPQILKQGGINYFVTQKLRWNDTTQFPHEVFWWRSPDGTAILSLMSAPIGEGIDPTKMATYAAGWEAKTEISAALWLPGVGDHGGGPTRDMLQVARRWQRSPLFPELKFSSVLDYLRQLERSPIDPVWDNELYLEFHRGCYTTHADQKQQNRQAEFLLYQAELFASVACLVSDRPYPKAALEAAWKQTLFNQFHDILPGSAIPEVFVDANQAWAEAIHTASEILEQSLRAIASCLALPEPPHSEARPIVVFNPLNWARSHIVEIVLPESEQPLDWHIRDLKGKEIFSQRRFVKSVPAPSGEKGLCSISFLTNQIPSVGYRVFWLCPGQATVEPLESTPNLQPFVLENEYLRVTVDPDTGDLASVWDKTQNREVLSRPGNQLQAFQDQGQYWDAWNIDPAYTEHPLPSAKLLAIDVVEQGLLRDRIRVRRQIGQSEFCQDYILECGSAFLTISTTVNWQERHVLVKAAFPLTVESSFATYEIPCGAIQRPTQPTDPHEKAKWEVPALHWADLSQPDYGVSVLNDCKYGYDAQPNQLRLTLLRSAEWPDLEADRGLHQFTYALYPHAGSWQAADTVRRGYELNVPLKAIVLPPERPESRSGDRESILPPVGQFLDLQADNLIVSAFKQSEDDPSEWILRCYECHGELGEIRLNSDLGFAIADAVDLLERPIHQGEHPVTDTIAAVQPWKIASFKLKPT